MRWQHPSDPFLAKPQKIPFYCSGWMTEKELTHVHSPIFHVRLPWEVEDPQALLAESLAS